MKFLAGFMARGTDAGSYCEYEPLLDSEKELLFSVIQEVTNFELLKDIRNELKDSKKDLEGRLYGYNPNFANLIASTEEFLHGKSSCLEPCQEEIDFYKMPVGLVYSEAEVEYLKMKPPLDVVGGESPSQVIRAAMEESTRLFHKAVIHTACGTRQLPSPREYKTKVIVVIEDNNEVLELLTVALWFFERTPLATFQAKFCHSTPEFLLSVDACRVYFGSSPVYSTKEDGEHLFERWLGVGMNGILRSFQSKILLIDFPRPGTNLQKLKNILYDRLKIEKQHNIKSLYVGKPNRKEDNLSTVENVLDEIQKCLEPRDRLLFRKARRMYLDLKLYKQIEQKSRQDLKCSRDWGIPEPDPDNGHDLLEGLRNSEVVVNCVPQPGILDLVTLTENQPTLSVQDSEPSYANDENLSETNSIRNEKDHSAELYESDDEDLILETLRRQHQHDDREDCEQTTTSSLSENLLHNVISYFSTHQRKIVMHTESNSGDTESNERSIRRRDNISSSDSGSEADREDFTASLHFDDMVAETEVPSEKTSTGTLPEFFHTESKKETLVEDTDNAQTSNEFVRDGNSSNYAKSELSHSSESISNDKIDQEDQYYSNSPFRKSESFVKIVMGLTTENFHDMKSSKESLLNANVDAQKCTRLEFTLAPKASSGESSLCCQSNTSIFENFLKSLEPTAEKRPTTGSSTDKPSIKATKNMALPKSKSLHETCKAYLHKLGKSVSHILRKPKSRRIFPERLIYTASSVDESQSHSFQNWTIGGQSVSVRKTSEGEVTDVVQENKGIKLNKLTEEGRNKENRNSGWLQSLSRIFRIKRSKRF